MAPKDKDSTEVSSDKGRLFTSDERIEIRKLLVAKEHREWLKNSISGWISWAALIVSGLTLGWESIKKLGRYIFG